VKNLSFDQATHTYTIKGKAIPSVTQIASAVTGKSVSNIPPAVLAKATARGTAIHADVEGKAFETVEGAWIKAQLGDAEYSAEVQGAGEIAGEPFAGTCDLLGDDEIGDIKTQGEADVLFWTIQLNLYRRMFPDRKRLFVLWTPKSGNYKRMEIPVLSESLMGEVMDAYVGMQVLPSTWPAVVDEDKAPSLDLVVYTNNAGDLTTNAKAILAAVKAQLAGYKAENYSEANIAEAKRDKAELNAAEKKLNARRLELERDFMKPFGEFKDTISETCAEIKKASSLIDSVVREVEDREKEEKRALIVEWFDAQGIELFGIAQIWNPAWLNRTSKVKDIQMEILAKAEKTAADLVVLDRIGEPEAKAHYLSTLDLESALAEADRIKANRKRIEDMESSRKATIASKAPLPSVGTPKAPIAQPAQAVAQRSEGQASPEILERTMRVRGTMEQIVALGKWMNENDIDFEKLQ